MADSNFVEIKKFIKIKTKKHGPNKTIKLYFIVFSEHVFFNELKNIYIIIKLFLDEK